MLFLGGGRASGFIGGSGKEVTLRAESSSIRKRVVPATQVSDWS